MSTKPQSTEAPESCPFCGVTGKRDIPSHVGWFVIEHDKDCFLARWLPAGVWQQIHVSDFPKWNTRYSPASAAPVVDNSVAFNAYNQAIEDVKAAIRGEPTTEHGDDDGSYFAAAFINAIARKCSPHVYVNRLAAATAAPVEKSDSLLTKIAIICDLGSAEEFGDALERLQGIRRLIDDEGAR